MQKYFSFSIWANMLADKNNHLKNILYTVDLRTQFQVVTS